MACNDYSNGSAPQVVFSVSNLPPGFCPDGYQALFGAIATYLQGTLPTNYSTFLIRDSTPAVTDRDKLWLSVDPSNCRPLGFYLYSTTNAAWVPVGNQVWNGDGSWSGTVIQSTVSPTLKYLTDGHLFIIKAPPSANAGAADLNVSSLGDKDITKFGGQPLEGGEILPNALLLLTWRSAANSFELLNPATASASLTPVNRLINGSFEVDSDGDGEPDGWTFDSAGGTPGGATGGISTVTVGHGAQSYEIDGAANTSGSLLMQAMQPCKGDGATYSDGELMLLSFWHRNTDQNNDDEISVEWFDKGGNSVGGPTVIWAWDTAITAVNEWRRFYAPMIPPAAVDARFFKLSLIGNSTGGGVGQTYFDGLAVETITFKRKLECSTAGMYSWVCPAGVFSVRVTCVGGGGAGGGGVTYGGGGGGAGGVATSIVNTTPGQAYVIVVGAAGVGAAGLNGANGTSTNFNAGQVIGGGGGGGFANGGAGGTGGIGTGQIVFAGENGITLITSGFGGNGGSSYSVGGMGAVTTVNGNVAGGNGGGGGGGGASGVYTAGGAGGGGFIRIEY